MESRWAPGDVVGCFLDFENGTLSFTLNYRLLGVPFTDAFAPERKSEGQIFPAVTLWKGQQVSMVRTNKCVNEKFSIHFLK